MDSKWLEDLQGVLHVDTQVTPLGLLVRLLLALAFGAVVSVIYKGTRRGAVTPTFPPTLVILAVLIAMVTQVIGDQVARAFSLVGALSIVRFRTVVEDAHDIAFVMFAVVVGMAVGAGQWWVAPVGIVVVGSAALLYRQHDSSRWSSTRSELSLRLAVGRDPDALYRDVFAKFLDEVQMVSGATGKQGTSFDLKYLVRLRRSAKPFELLDALHQIQGTQHVELENK